MGPLGLLSPHPGVSYLFTGADAAPAHEGEGSLWGIAHANPSLAQVYGGGLGSPPPQVNSTILDSVRQLDSRLKVMSIQNSWHGGPNTTLTQKLIAMLLKELDDCARQGIRDELASLDPLLRNVAVPEDSRELYDYEG